MESNGEIVYRLFGDVINHYKELFEYTEDRWRRNVHRNSYFDSDFHFVSTLPEEYRYQFWIEKIAYFTNHKIGPAAFDPSLIDSIYWLHHYSRYEELEAELLLVIKNLRSENKVLHSIHRGPIFYFRDFINRIVG